MARPNAPIARPRNTVPSASARMAGVIAGSRETRLSGATMGAGDISDERLKQPASDGDVALTLVASKGARTCEAGTCARIHGRSRFERAIIPAASRQRTPLIN